MPRKCQVTGRVSSTGKKYAIRGIAKKKKGIGLNITGITKRRFLPNLVKKKFWFAEENRWVPLRVSAAAIRTITKNGLAAVIRDLRAKGQTV